MATEITVQSSGSAPPRKIGIPTLNNVLINVLLNRSKYTQAVAAGDGFRPVKCASMRSAAYRFAPTIELSPQEAAESSGDALPVSELLPGGDEEQIVSYWRGCDKESDLPKNFEPSGVVRSMKPKYSGDRLGLLERLRIAKETCEDLIKVGKRGGSGAEAFEHLTKSTSYEAIETEIQRLKRSLLEVREKASDVLNEQIPKEFKQGGEDITISVQTPLERLQSLLDGPNDDAVIEVIEKKRELDRLNSIMDQSEDDANG